MTRRKDKYRNDSTETAQIAKNGTPDGPSPRQTHASAPRFNDLT